MIDAINYAIIRKAYENYVEEISYCHNDKELSLIVKKFLNFLEGIRGSISNKGLIHYINEQIRIAKRILFISRIKYFIIFVYHFIINRLVNQLLNAIKRFLSLI